ncbi:DUF3147 family protein [Alicyclobacillaceae bacterium I2511]|nr:DUF3147 family protein [Alicyclobacillaceae bacterium I2511]
MDLILIKFIIGGLVITGVTVLANRLGGRVGGILSGFPAIFMTALVMQAWGSVGAAPDARLTAMVTASLGAVGANLVMVWVAPKAIVRLRFDRALFAMVGIWLAVSGFTAVVLQI